jgi:hypothetical protein
MNVTVKRLDPQPPPIYQVTIDLNLAETNELKALLGRAAYTDFTNGLWKRLREHVGDE